MDDDRVTLLPVFAWMVGTTRSWTERLSSNFTIAENQLDNSDFQPADSLDRTRYLAANLIWNPIERVNIGVEYLHGVRKNVDGGEGHANRLQGAFIFDLP